MPNTSRSMITDSAMTTPAGTFDPTYARRYVNRNKSKVEEILKHVGEVESVLDIGCNAGYISMALLQSGQVKQVDGVELDAQVVDKRLMANEAFRLYECNAVDFVFDQVYDAVVYAAVHHHVLGTAGIDVGWSLWHRILDHCNTTLIFETGLLVEKGKYYWKDAIRDHFVDDDTYIKSLFYAVGPRLRGVTEISTPPIHGVVRPLYVLSLWPLNSEFDLQNTPAFYGELYSRQDSWQVVNSYYRTVGSKQQQLVSREHLGHSKGNRVYKDTEFHILQHRQTSTMAFSKKPVSTYYKQMREFRILQCLDHPRIIKLIEVNENYGLVFSYKPWLPLPEVDFHTITNLQEFRDQIIDFYKYAASVEIDLGVLQVDWEKPIMDGARHLIDIVDLHGSNFLLEVVDGQVSNWVVIDMEYFSSNNRQRNERHKQQILELLDPSTLRSLRKRFAREIRRRLQKVS